MNYRYEYHPERLSPGEWKLAHTNDGIQVLDGNGDMGAFCEHHMNGRADARAITQLKPAMDLLWDQISNTPALTTDEDGSHIVESMTEYKILTAAGLLVKIELP